VRRLDAPQGPVQEQPHQGTHAAVRLCAGGNGTDTAYMPLHGFTAVDLGYQQGNAVSNLVNKMDEPAFAATYLSLFDQIWNDPEKLEDVTAQICEHIASVYQENSPESIYFLMLYNIFNEFLDDIDEDVLPNDRTGYQDTLIWNKLFNYQKDAATGIINKLETYSGCILADSVGLGQDLHGAGRRQVLRAAQQVRPGACAPRSWPTTGSTTTATSRPTSSPRTVSTTTCFATPTSAAPAANPSAHR
jgi:hypothetical protein